MQVNQRAAQTSRSNITTAHPMSPAVAARRWHPPLTVIGISVPRGSRRPHTAILLQVPCTARSAAELLGGALAVAKLAVALLSCPDSCRSQNTLVFPPLALVARSERSS